MYCRVPCNAMTMLSMAQCSNTALWLAYFRKRTGSRVTLLEYSKVTLLDYSRVTLLECSRGGKWKRLPGEIIVSRLMLALGTTSPPLVGPAGCNVGNSTLWRSQQCAMCNVVMCSVIKWLTDSERLAEMHTQEELNTWNTWKPMTRTSLCSGYIAYITIKEGLM